MIASDRRAQVLRALAHSLRSEPVLRSALMRWPLLVGEPDAAALRPAARLARLGAPVGDAIRAVQPEIGPEGALLEALAVAHAEVGGDLAKLIDALADDVEASVAAEARGRAHLAGAVMSRRMMGVLPVMFLPLIPLLGTPILDRLGLLTLAAGGALAGTGALWMRRLSPAAPSADLVALLARAIAAFLRAGISLETSCRSLCRALRRLEPGLGRVDRLNRLGLAWTDAFARSGHPGLVELARVFGPSSNGVSVSGNLEAFAGARESAAERRFEELIRRAAVKAALPLVSCALPAFVLLGIVPFFREGTVPP